MALKLTRLIILILSIKNVHSILAKNSSKYLKTSNFKYSILKNHPLQKFRFSGFTDEEKDRFESETLYLTL